MRSKKSYEDKEQEIGSELMRHLEKMFMLQAVDQQWKDHLLAMDHLKEGVGLRGYGQKDPLIEYKKEGFDMFEEMKLRIVETTVENLFRVRAGEGRTTGDRAQAETPAGTAQLRRRRRCGSSSAHAGPRREKGGAQRSLPLRERKEIQEMPREVRAVRSDEFEVRSKNR